MKGFPMLSVRQTASAVGVLFLVATATFLAADSIVSGVLVNPDALADVSEKGNLLKAAALLAFVDGIAVVGIAVLMYPALKEHSEPLALGYVGFRVAELVAVVLYLAVPLLLVAVGSASGPLGSLFQAGYEVSLMVLFLLTGVSGIVVSIVLCRSGLVPRALSALGLLGYSVLLGGSVLHMFRLIDLFAGPGTMVAVPVGLFEVILPIWLIAKGFTAVPRDIVGGGP